jgi:uncharacterized membrane protein YgdD (TMEM256/DUF423 family)
MRANHWIGIGALTAAAAVALGAFGAHALKETLEPEQLEIWHTAVQYQVLHALALIIFGLYRGRHPSSNLPGWAFLVGSVCFSGSLYGLALGGPRFLGPITPLGGLAFLFGWILLGLAALRQKR